MKMFESKRERYLLQDIKEMMPRENSLERDNWISELIRQIDVVKDEVIQEIAYNQNIEAIKKHKEAKLEAQRNYEYYKTDEQLTTTSKVYAKTEQGRLEKAELERQEKVDRWRLEAREKGMNQKETEEYIKLKSMNQAEYVDYVNEQNQKEVNNTLDKWQSKSRTQYSDLDEYF